MVLIFVGQTIHLILNIVFRSHHLLKRPQSDSKCFQKKNCNYYITCVWFRVTHKTYLISVSDSLLFLHRSCVSEAQRMDVGPGLPGFKSHLHRLFVIGSGSRFLSLKEVLGSIYSTINQAKGSIFPRVMVKMK